MFHVTVVQILHVVCCCGIHVSAGQTFPISLAVTRLSEVLADMLLHLVLQS